MKFVIIKGANIDEKVVELKKISDYNSSRSENYDLTETQKVIIEKLKILYKTIEKETTNLMDID